MFTNDTDLTLKGEFLDISNRYHNETWHYRKEFENSEIGWVFGEAWSIMSIMPDIDGPHPFFREINEEISHDAEIYAFARILDFIDNEYFLEMSYGNDHGSEDYCGECGDHLHALNRGPYIAHCLACHNDYEARKEFNEFDGVKISDVFADNVETQLTFDDF